MPIGNEKYCDKCKKGVLKFMDDFGVGVLMQDLKVEEQNKRIKYLEDENNSLLVKLEKANIKLRKLMGEVGKTVL